MNTQASDTNPVLNYIKDYYSEHAQHYCDWEPSLPFKTCFDHVVIQRSHDLAKRLGRSVRVLDVGCGHGNWLMRLASAAQQKSFGLEAFGVDIASARIEAGSVELEKAGISNVHLYSENIYDWQPPQAPDLIVASEILALLPRSMRSSFLKRLVSILVPEALLVIIDKALFSAYWYGHMLSRYQGLLPEIHTRMVRYPWFWWMKKKLCSYGCEVVADQKFQHFRGLTLQKKST